MTYIEAFHLQPTDNKRRWASQSQLDIAHGAVQNLPYRSYNIILYDTESPLTSIRPNRSNLTQWNSHSFTESNAKCPTDFVKQLCSFFGRFVSPSNDDCHNRGRRRWLWRRLIWRCNRGIRLRSPPDADRMRCFQWGGPSKYTAASLCCALPRCCFYMLTWLFVSLFVYAPASIFGFCIVVGFAVKEWPNVRQPTLAGGHWNTRLGTAAFEYPPK